MRATFGAAVAVAALTACASEYHPEYRPNTQYSYSQAITSPVTIFQSGSQTPISTGAPAPAPINAGGDPARVLVLQTKHLDRPAEVIGVVDAHEAMGRHEAALWTLRKKAALLGADAVIGVEFNHGEGHDEPTHLSGLAVRFLRAVPYPTD